MATTIQAITRYRPRLIADCTIGVTELAEDMARSTLATESVVRLVLSDLCPEIVRALLAGNAVKLPGIGRFALELRTDGTVRPVVRLDHALRKAVGNLDDYRGIVRHRESIGLTAAEMVERWNEEHPEDPVRVA